MRAVSCAAVLAVLYHCTCQDATDVRSAMCSKQRRTLGWAK